MSFLSESEFENIFVLHPELIETGIQLVGSQIQLETRRIDVLYKDQNGQLVCVELKKDVINSNHVQQIVDYVKRFARAGRHVRGMLIGQYVPQPIRHECDQYNIEWKEVREAYLFEYLKQHDHTLFEQIFIHHKVPIERLEHVKKAAFEDYREENAMYGIPLSSYQFLRPKDSSPKLSDDATLNARVADEFILRIITVPFKREMFHGRVVLTRDVDTPIRNVVFTGNGAWTGQALTFHICLPNGTVIQTLYLYTGSVGMRGNSPTYVDKKSRFLVVSFASQKKEGATQYSFHKHLCTDERALLPTHELKFPSQTIGKTLQPQVYDLLEKFGYNVVDKQKGIGKMLWIGDTQLDSPNIDAQLGNLLEHLFALAIVKEQVKKRHYHFHFLE